VGKLGGEEGLANSPAVEPLGAGAGAPEPDWGPPVAGPDQGGQRTPVAGPAHASCWGDLVDVPPAWTPGAGVASPPAGRGPATGRVMYSPPRALPSLAVLPTRRVWRAHPARPRPRRDPPGWWHRAGRPGRSGRQRPAEVGGEPVGRRRRVMRPARHVGDPTLPPTHRLPTTCRASGAPSCEAPYRAWLRCI
jgi:hypothetical protein